LIVEKNDREVQWHAKNGLLLFGAEFVLGTLLSISSFVRAPTWLGRAARWTRGAGSQRQENGQT